MNSRIYKYINRTRFKPQKCISIVEKVSSFQKIHKTLNESSLKTALLSCIMPRHKYKTDTCCVLVMYTFKQKTQADKQIGSM